MPEVKDNVKSTDAAQAEETRLMNCPRSCACDHECTDDEDDGCQDDFCVCADCECEALRFQVREEEERALEERRMPGCECACHKRACESHKSSYGYCVCRWCGHACNWNWAWYKADGRDRQRHCRLDACFYENGVVCGFGCLCPECANSFWFAPPVQARELLSRRSSADVDAAFSKEIHRCLVWGCCATFATKWGLDIHLTSHHPNPASPRRLC